MKLYKYDQKQLVYNKVSSWDVFTTIFCTVGVIAVTAILCSAIAYKSGEHNGKSHMTPEEISLVIEKTDEFSPDKLQRYLIELNIKFPEIVYAQAVLETGTFSSPVFKGNHNLFGMKEAKVRPTTNLGTDQGHAVYRSWRESVIDYALYQTAYLSTIQTEEEYYNYLSKFYAEDPAYVSKVQTIAAKNAASGNLDQDQE
jgi:hypothetical protein